ncbi:MAG: polynucleotide adenylyltransferase PcnB [Victivallaceae bacterium]|nr:polynucleotide adenylyltransferase PcnB [Victivallaceae bacterium]
MIRLRNTAPYIREIVKKLQDAGYEAYIVGGAVRDLLLDRTPKDYDISTAATPQEIRNVFGRRQARIIGKRFRLVHLHVGREIIEISTFRRRPDSQGEVPQKLADTDVPDHMIFDDNDFGSAQEDAFRRDFTVNALFYDPVVDNLIDYTGMGVDDINNRIVRIIGNGRERFEEDPVRLLRALKLIGQYGFSFDEGTEAALMASIPLIQHAAQSRLSLELEKILTSSYSDRILAAFQRYGFLKYFLPFLAEHWNDELCVRSMQMLSCRNRRVMAERYRNSISVATATIALPFVAARFGAAEAGSLWTPGEETTESEISDIIHEVFTPHTIVRRVIYSAAKMLFMQPNMLECKRVARIASSKSMPHARELLYIQNELWWHRADLIDVWERQRARTADDEPDDEHTDAAGNGDTARRRRPRRRSRRSPDRRLEQ